MTGLLDATPRFIPTAVHAPLDYLTGGKVLAVPALLGQQPGPSRTATQAWGVMAFMSGLTTRHELGLVRGMSMRQHLAGDAVGGAMLMAVPWLTGDHSSPRQWLPPTLVGASEVLLAATTEARSALPQPTARRVQAVAGGAAVLAGLLLLRRSPAAGVLAAAGVVAVVTATRVPRELPQVAA